ncbi:hypothetical protein CC1G_00819 [Coprinopsis cinerea okayama7|uniref:Uncharacterized protein n=1 Tax=Coprinopsis cinerea (strain Okayama-7 / 130 / ATCC MYA-4618 / FGSC 9003) TaxID=240176 RepID=A8N8U4_COPC7|nr:hypothetical protein CC1G_00819 [Coprinopsis cinerea okayama7\|eukprot:XP_001831272.2 hypothetical protein CC1G_00819 [Coprinopsis cinerea okayama7\
MSASPNDDPIASGQSGEGTSSTKANDEQAQQQQPQAEEEGPKTYHVLVTGFGPQPFMKHKTNPSWLAVKALHNMTISSDQWFDVFGNIVVATPGSEKKGPVGSTSAGTATPPGAAPAPVSSPIVSHGKRSWETAMLLRTITSELPHQSLLHPNRPSRPQLGPQSSRTHPWRRSQARLFPHCPNQAHSTFTSPRSKSRSCTKQFSTSSPASTSNPPSSLPTRPSSSSHPISHLPRKADMILSSILVLLGGAR